MTTLHVSDGLALPVDIVTQTNLIFGKRGSGKTATAGVLTEEMVMAGQTVAILDPMDAWWGIRSSADGQSPGLPVTIFGGEHADLPLEPGSGTAIADLIVGERIPAVLSMFLMSKTQQRQFVTDFMERLFHKNRDPMHLVVDEADRWAPQRGTHDMARLLGAYEDIVLRGRRLGLGSTSITLRVAQLNAAIRSQVEVLWAMRTLGKLDIQAIDEWIRLHADEEEARDLKASLPSLPVGTAWVWSPGWLELLAKVAIRPRLTFDSSATPKVGETRIVPRAFARVDPASLERLAARLGHDSTSDGGAADPAEVGDLSAQVVRDLRAQVRRLTKELEAERAAPPKIVEVPVLAPEAAAEARAALATLDRVAANFRAALGTKPPTPAAPPAPAPPRPAPGAAPPAGAPSLKAGARRMLTVLARQRPLTVTRAQLASLAGMKRTGGTFQSYFSTLKTGALITEDGGQVAITDAGLAAAGVDPGTPPVTTGEIREQWRSALKAGARTMLDALLAAYPAGLTRDQLAAAAGLEKTGGTFQSYLSALRSNGLAEVTGDEVRAADVFFLVPGDA